MIINEIKKKDNKKCRALIMCRGKKKLGFIKVFKKYKRDTVYELEYFVKEKYRNQGLIKKYLPIMFDILREEGIDRLSAHVKVDNLVSNWILLKHDFVKIETIKDVNIYARSLNEITNAHFKYMMLHLNEISKT